MFNQYTENQIKLSAARLPISGAYSGIGTYGYINFTPSETATGVSFNFSQDLSADNTLVDDNINNVLTEAVSKTYPVKDRYNIPVDGKGFCTPDSTGPTVLFYNASGEFLEQPREYECDFCSIRLSHRC